MSGYESKLESSRNCLRRIARHDEPQFSKHSIVNVMEKFVKTVNTMDETILVPCRLMDRQVGDSTDIATTPARESTANQLSMSVHSHGKRHSNNSKNVHEFLNSSELFNLYSMLNALKNDLLWTGKDKAVEEEDTQNIIYAESVRVEEVENNATLARSDSAKMTEVASSTESATIVNNNNNNVNAPVTNTIAPTTVVKGHVRRPSTASVASTVSVSNLSDSESDLSQENDSGMESDANKCDNPQSGSSAESVSGSSSEGDVRTQKLANMDKATELAKRCKRHLNGLYQCLEQMTEAANYLTVRYQSDIGGPV